MEFDVEAFSDLLEVDKSLDLTLKFLNFRHCNDGSAFDDFDLKSKSTHHQNSLIWTN